jgi:predicted Zn-dependent protease
MRTVPALGTAIFTGIFAAAAAGGGAISLISVGDEIKLGREAQGRLRKDVPLVADQAITDYVGRLGRRLAAHAPGPPYPYSFSVADHRELNAFALPGGPVWVNRGILQAAANESQVAAVLAHEIAHIAERHAADRIATQLVTNGLLGLLGAMLGNDAGGARTARIGAEVLASGYLLTFSREDELQADRTGVGIVRRAGWDPRGMADFLDVIRRAQGRDPGSVEVFLSSHPAPGERATLLRRTIGTRATGRSDSGEFKAVKARLLKLPPAKPTKRR